MLNPLKITYLFESTALWGGNKVGLEQAEALSEIGYEVTILSKDAGPTWYPLKLPVNPVSSFDAATIPESDIIVGTFWPTVKAAYESGKGISVHLCQGYEGGNREYFALKAAIDEVYSYKIPKLIVSSHLERFLKERFNAETYYIGQLLNKNIFSPSRNRRKWFNLLKLPGLHPLRILIVGPFEADVKNIPVALKGVLLAKKKLKIPIRLIRASQFSLTTEEKEIIEPDTYHVQVPYYSMGEIYRNADILISVSKEAEGFGLPALEAMACGVATILSRIPSHLALDEIHDYALFVEPSDSDALASAIHAIFSNGRLRESLIRHGLSVAEKFTKEAVVARLTAAFEQIISRTKTQRRE